MSKEWNLGETNKKNLTAAVEKAVLVAVHLPNQTEQEVQEYLDELSFLTQTAGAEVVKQFTQRARKADNVTFLGKGKIEEVRQYIADHEEVTLAIFDDDLSGKQTSALEEMLKVKVVDRSSLILDIFANRAQTAQAKTQVELAQIQYLLPRLRGLWSHLERQRGGIGMRGPGEKEIETDRRIVREKIDFLKRKLEKIDVQNQTNRKQRGELIRVSLVGYTNVGKSTLMTLLSKSEVFAENKLFATLDTTVRKIAWEAVPFLLSDTVGFIRKLPHHLIESFKSTLDEVCESDILIHVVDISHPNYEGQLATVQQTLRELKADEKPTLYVFNKIDEYRKLNYDAFLDEEGKSEIEGELLKHLKAVLNDAELIFISATKRENIDNLRATILKLVKEAYTIRYPFQTHQW